MHYVRRISLISALMSGAILSVFYMLGMGSLVALFSLFPSLIIIHLVSFVLYDFYLSYVLIYPLCDGIRRRLKAKPRYRT